MVFGYPRNQHKVAGELEKKNSQRESTTFLKATVRGNELE
jgi:hypothetical protein